MHFILGSTPFLLFGAGPAALGLAAYMGVVVIEPVLDLAVLAAAKALHRLADRKVFHARLYQSAA